MSKNKEDLKHWKYKNITYFIRKANYSPYVCAACNQKQTSNCNYLGPYGQVKLLGFNHSLFCDNCLKNLIKNTDKFLFKFNVGLL